MENNKNAEKIHKKGRHRKKQLYTSILNQMEFYFSDSNLTKDRFLASLIQENTCVNLDVFLKFNKIKKLTTNIEDIRKAIKNSTLIKLSEDQNSILRNQPVVKKLNVDDCTIYVERLKSDATHDWLNSVFSEFGNVVYVSIPKYKHNNALKGFAFIEFENEKEAENALNYFDSIACKMSSTGEPEELCSIATFQVDNEMTENNETNDNLIKLPSTSPIEDVGNDKKRKFDEISEANDDNKEKKLKTENDELENEESDGKKKKKHKKEQKKKHYFKELGLQVLSKKEWKKMRNRYLDLQRKKMKEFKRYLHRTKFSQSNYDDKGKKIQENNTEEKPAQELCPKLEFVEGVIVKINLPEPCADAKKLKNELKASSSEIKYVDVPNPGCNDVYLRFNSRDNAKIYCQQDGNEKAEILEGDEQQAYWDRILESREEQFKKSNKKQRGRDKLLKKANKVTAQHIKFDE